MKLKRINVVNINNVLESLVKDTAVKPFDFKYKSKKIRESIKVEVEAVKELQPKLRNDYQNKINDILIANAEKDEAGNPKTVGNTNLVKDLVIPSENQPIIAEKVSEINKSTNFEDVIKEEKQFEEFMLEEIEVDIPKFSKKDLWDSISDEAVEILFDIIESEE